MTDITAVHTKLIDSGVFDPKMVNDPETVEDFAIGFQRVKEVLRLEFLFFVKISE